MMYPEMLHQMQSIHLPTLAALHLSTRVIIFTAQELEVWGSRYGWPELEHLSIFRATDLVPFICRVPRLTFLHLTADLCAGMEDIKECLLQAPSNVRPLGIMDSLVYNHFASSDVPSAWSHVVPWSIINVVKDTLTRYHAVHQPYELFLPGFVTPGGYRIRQLQQKCPNLTHLAVDVNVNLEEDQRTHLMRTFGKFNRLENLMLYMHRPMNHICGWHFDSEADCTEAYERITKDRHNVCADLEVNFKEMFNYAYGASRPHTNWTFWMNEAGLPQHRGNVMEPEVKGQHGKEVFACLTDDELVQGYCEEKRQYGSLARSYIVDGIQRCAWTVMKDEIERRQKAVKVSSFTLYDSWTTSDSERS
jgi:hypothetical protein